MVQANGRGGIRAAMTDFERKRAIGTLRLGPSVNDDPVHAKKSQRATASCGVELGYAARRW
jgi:hypothetical protein